MKSASRALSLCKSSAPAKRRRRRNQFRSIASRDSTPHLARSHEVQSRNRLGLCQPLQPRPKAVLVPVTHEESNQRGWANCWHCQEDRVAYLPPHLCDALARERRGHQGCSGTPPACVLPRHSGHLHLGRYRTEASSAKQDRWFSARTQATDSPDKPSFTDTRS
jgi:hypothetical protein